MSKTYYQIDGFLKMSEQDIYNDGCQPDTSNTYWIDHLIQNCSLDGLIDGIKSFTDAENDDLSLNSCDEIGRIDAQVMETSGGIKANDRDFDLWKQGKIDLYLVTYSCQVKLINETDVDLLKGI